MLSTRWPLGEVLLVRTPFRLLAVTSFDSRSAFKFERFLVTCLFIESIMAITLRAPVSDDVSQSRIVVSVALIVALGATIGCLMWVKRRIRQTTPVTTPLERLPSHEARRRKGIDSYLLDSIPVITYRASLESNDREGISKIGNSTGGGLSGDPPKRAMMVQTQEDNGELPVESLDTSIKNIDMQVDEGANQGKERKGSRQDSKICSICTEDFVEGRNVRILPCHHIYHRRCIDPWLLNFAGTCPLWYVPLIYEVYSDD